MEIILMLKEQNNCCSATNNELFFMSLFLFIVCAKDLYVGFSDIQHLESISIWTSNIYLIK